MYKRRNVVATANFTIPKVTYLDFDGTSGKMVERTDECELVKAETTTFEAGKVYTVLGNVTIEKRITVNGTPQSPAKLVLCDGATLMAMNGIDVSAGNALTICGQALGTGTLEAMAPSNTVGIGIGGTVTINGGTVTAVGGSSAAGIGGTVTINGGTVTATGSDGAAGIVGTVKFADGTAYGVAAGAAETNAIYKTAAAYATDHSAAYVALPYFSLKIPKAPEAYSYEVSSMGVQPTAVLANQTNTYAIAAGATVRVNFTAEGDYVFDGPFDNPKIIANLSGDTVIDAADLPTTKFVKKGSAGNPWAVGKTVLDSVTVWTNGVGGLVIEGRGEMRDFTEGDPAPWGTDITEVEIGEEVMGIGARAFEDSQLVSVTIPASVISIGAAAFFGSTSLSCVAVEAMTPPALGEGAFVEVAEGYQICVPVGTGAVYKAAPDWSLYADHIFEGRPGSLTNPWTVGTPNADDVIAYTNGIGGLVVEGEGDMKDFDPTKDYAPWGTDIAEVEIGEDVTGVGAKAFAGCTSLSNVTVEAVTPPALGADALENVAEDLTIYVPFGTGEAYKAAPGWSDFAERIVELPQVIAAESDGFAVDLRTDVALATGETNVSNVWWSATAWGAVPGSTSTDLGYTNKTTGETGVLAEGLTGENVDDCLLPQKDGKYVLTHSTGDLKSFVTFVVSGYPVGGETNPWTVGPADDPDGVVAWTDGNGNVYFKPPRGTVSRTGLEAITNAMGGASFPAWLVSNDRSATNDLVMVIGASGAKYGSLAEALEAGEDSYRLYDINCCVVNYDGMGHSGTMEPDTFLPGIPTNLTANAFTAFGYTFQGWTTNFGSEVIFEDRALIANPRAGDVYDLQAVWKNAPVPVGDGVGAYLDAHGALHIVGAGEMKDFTEADPAPWAGIASQVKSVEIGGGVTKVGNAAFAALDYKATTETFVFLDEAHELNPFAFVSADKSVTNAPAVEAFRVFNPKSGAEPAAAFYSEATGAFYDSISGALQEGEDTLRLVTLEDVKDLFREGLIEAAGEKPYSKAMQDLLGQAFEELDAAKTLADAAGVADKYAAPIQEQATLDRVKGEVESEIAKEAGPQPWTENVEAAITEAVRKIDAAKTEEEIWNAGADGIAAVRAAKAKDADNPDLGGTIPECEIPWELKGGQLTLDGSGEMPELTRETVPWSNSVEKVDTIVVAEGVTELSKGLFTSELSSTLTVIFESKDNEIQLRAFVSADGAETNDVTDVLFGQDGKYQVPSQWVDDSGNIHESYAKALEAGAEAVRPVFATSSDTVEEQIEKAPAKIREDVPAFDENTGRFTTDPEGNLIDVVATVENVNTNDVETSERITVSAFSGLKEAARLEASESVGVTVLSLTVDAMPTNSANEAQQVLAFVMTNGLDSAEGFAAKFAEITLATNDVPIAEAKAVIEIHIPYGTSGRENFSVTRIHDGTVDRFRQIGVPAETPEDGTFMVRDGEIVVWTMRFSLYAIGSTGSGMLPAFGTVKYPKVSKSTGYLKAGTNATWTAKAGEGCVFAGWAWTNGTPAASFALLSENERRNKKLKVKVVRGDQILPTDVAASWVWLDEDRIQSVELTPSNLAVVCRSYVTATVSGLPNGLKFNRKSLAITGTPRKDGTKTVKVSVKNASGYTWKQSFSVTVAGGAVTSVVPADNQVLTGEPVVLWGEPTLGKVKGSKVYVAGKKASLRATPAKGSVFLGWYEDAAFANAATNLPKGYHAAAQSVVVPAEGLKLFARFVELEDWTVGTFDGVYYEMEGGTNAVESGTVTFTVSSKGKVSGKTLVGGKSYSFKANSLADAFEVDGRYSFIAYPTMRVGKEVKEIVLSISLNESTGLGAAEIFYGEEADAPFAAAVQNGWKLKPSVLPAFPTGKAALELSVTNGVDLTLKFGAKGVVTVKGTVDGEKVSAKAQVLPVAQSEGAFVAAVCVYAPKAGFCKTYNVLLTVGADDKFDSVSASVAFDPPPMPHPVITPAP